MGTCFQENNCQFDDPSYVPEKIRALVTRVSRHFQLKGPIVQADTACGSSFSALVEAFVAMKFGLCDRIIVCGANTIFRPRISLQFKDLKMVNKDGRCKCLDSSVGIFVFSFPLINFEQFSFSLALDGCFNCRHKLTTGKWLRQVRGLCGDAFAKKHRSKANLLQNS